MSNLYCWEQARIEAALAMENTVDAAYTVKYRMRTRDSVSVLLPVIKILFWVALVCGALMWLCSSNKMAVWVALTSVFLGSAGRILYIMLFTLLGAGIGGLIGCFIGAAVSLLISMKKRQPREIEVRLTETGAEIRLDGIQAFYDWPAIRSVRRHGSNISLVCSTPGFTAISVIPGSAFESKGAGEAFFYFAESAWKKAKPKAAKLENASAD